MVTAWRMRVLRESGRKAGGLHKWLIVGLFRKVAQGLL